MTQKAVKSLPDHEALERVRAELCRRLQAGEDCSAQDYLDTNPSLAQSEECAVELIVSEFQERRRLCQPAEPASLLQRYPRWRERLERALYPGVELTAATTAEPTVPQRPGANHPSDFPRSFHKFMLLGRLGGGGMGTVYRAYDPGLKREVALKQMLGEIKKDNPESETSQRFQREVQALFDLRHEHVIRLHDNAVADGYYTMELLTGGTLKDHKDRFKDSRAAAVVVEKIARGVHAAHQKGIIHRDLKPANVLLNAQGEPVVADFGVAKFLGGEGLTETGRILGTWAYMSPEQVEGDQKRINERSDIWALGVILYELACGRRPFVTEASEDSLQFRSLILNADPLRPHDLCPGIALDLETIILKCLRKAPEDRYRSAEQLADDLKKWLAGEPIQARPESWLRRTWRRAQPLGGKVGTPVAFVMLFLGLAAVLALTARVFLLPPSADKPPERLIADAPIHWLDRPDVSAGNGWNSTKGKGKMTRLEKGELRLEMPPKGLGLWELTNSVPWERYRFSVTVQQVGTAGFAGVYLDRGQAEPDNDERWILELRYAERNQFLPQPESTTKKAKTELRCRRIFWSTEAKEPAEPYVDRNHLLGEHYFTAAEETPRRLRLEVTRDTISGFWDNTDRLFVMIHRATDLNRTWKGLEGQKPARASNWLVAGSERVGLLCEGGTCVFSDAVLEPLP
jgi:serine/threonine protein kinase